MFKLNLDKGFRFMGFLVGIRLASTGMQELP
jgi:hypothetical protein